MPKSNVVKFPTQRPQKSRNPVAESPSRSAWRSRLILWTRRLAWHLIVSVGRKALLLVALTIFVAAWLGRLVYGVLSLAFIGKLWLHWGDASVWGPAQELAASLLIFGVLSAFLDWAKSLAPSAAAPQPLARLSWADRLLLLSRR